MTTSQFAAPPLAALDFADVEAAGLAVVVAAAAGVASRAFFLGPIAANIMARVVEGSKVSKQRKRWSRRFVDVVVSVAQVPDTTAPRRDGS